MAGKVKRVDKACNRYKRQKVP